MKTWTCVALLVVGGVVAGIFWRSELAPLGFSLAAIVAVVVAEYERRRDRTAGKGDGPRMEFERVSGSPLTYRVKAQGDG